MVQGGLNRHDGCADGGNGERECDGVNIGDKKEREFQEKLMRDLKKRGINVVDLGERGTFDMIVEGRHQHLVELKRVKKFHPRTTGEKKEYFGIGFTPSQSKEIQKMKFPPAVIAFDKKNRCYWFSANRVKKGVSDRSGHPRTIFLTRYFSEFRKPLGYKATLKKIERTAKT